jgi:hypothetical protein
MKLKKGMRALGLLFTAFIVSVILVQCVSATSNSNNGIDYVYEVTDLSDPISIDYLNEMRNSVIEKYQKAKGSQISIVYTEPEIPKDFEIVAYAFTINPQGITNQYVGLAGDEKSVAIIQKKAQDWREKNIIKQNSLTIDQTKSRSSDWVRVGRDTQDVFTDPFGGMTNNHEIRKLSNDGDSTKDWFAVQQIFAMEPGIRAFQSSYVNHVGKMSNDWSAGTFGNHQLFEWEPLGTISGSQGVAVSISGGTGGASATWTWSYNQPDVTTTDLSSTGTEIAKWTMDFNSDASKTSTGGMKTGSVCSVNQHSSGTYKILDLKAEGKFHDTLFGLYHTMNLNTGINYQY